MARIAAVAGPDPGHLLPVAAVAIGLHDAGHDVVVASGGPLLDRIREAGPQVVTLPALAPTPGDDDLAHILWRRAGDMAPPTRDLLAPFEPELVVTDTITTVGHFTADLLGVPSVEVNPHHLMDPSDDVPPVGLGRRPSSAPWRRLDDRHLRGRQGASLRLAERQRTAVRRDLGLGDRHGPVRRLLAVPPCLEYPRRDWPSDAVVVGPLIWEPPDWPRLSIPAGDEPLVVVTDTTASGAHEGLAAVAIRALASAPVRVVATSSDPAAHDAADGASNATVGRGSHLALLARADLAVGPGGGGFVGKAMWSGVPMVVVPGVGDQRETAMRIHVAGVGRRVRPGPLLDVRLRWAVLAALADPRLRRHAAACEAACRRGGVPAAVREVEEAVDRG